MIAPRRVRACTVKQTGIRAKAAKIRPRIYHLASNETGPNDVTEKTCNRPYVDCCVWTSATKLAARCSLINISVIATYIVNCETPRSVNDKSRLIAKHARACARNRHQRADDFGAGNAIPGSFAARRWVPINMYTV